MHSTKYDGDPGREVSPPRPPHVLLRREKRGWLAQLPSASYSRPEEPDAKQNQRRGRRHCDFD
jgi:hypothetical protein